MGGIQLAAELRWIMRNGHRLGVQDRIDGRSAHLCVGREPIERVADHGGDGDPAPLGANVSGNQPTTARRLAPDLAPMVSSSSSGRPCTRIRSPNILYAR
jgi:hypothetical protein